MTVVLVSSDLMGASSIEGAVRQAGTRLRQVGSTVAAAEVCSSDDEPLVLVDLAMAGIDVTELVTALRSVIKPAHAKPPAIVAYGPHVHEAKLAAAKAAGCDAVLSRGQFMSQAAQIVARFCQSAD